ncbi:hypothetical protein C8Q74DRAFT_1302770 [Fomes fomentarius]|nr:hypothetical protein C8Q74DRAFT_1302770 [Fomes fomentarius]
MYSIPAVVPTRAVPPHGGHLRLTLSHSIRRADVFVRPAGVVSASLIVVRPDTKPYLMV